MELNLQSSTPPWRLRGLRVQPCIWLVFLVTSSNLKLPRGPQESLISIAKTLITQEFLKVFETPCLKPEAKNKLYCTQVHK